VLGDAALLVLLAHDEARDVLEEDERHAARAGELDEMGRLERRLGEEHALVGEDADGVAVEGRETCHQRRPGERLELVEAPAVHEPSTMATCGMPAADMRAWLKKMRPKCSRSGKTSAWRGRKAPPESTR